MFDEMAEPLLTLSMPAPPSGLCFGRFHGSTLSTLFVGAADSIWAVPTNVQVRHHTPDDIYATRTGTRGP